MPCAKTLRVIPSMEEIAALGSARYREIGIYGLASLISDFERDRPPCFSLPDCHALDGVAVRGDVRHPQPHKIAAAQLAIDRQIEKRKLSGPLVELQLGTDRPDVLRLQGRLLAG